jgi:3',5'-cyclic-AMP phosphodiesterase
MLIAQISDLHIKADRKLAYGIVDTATMLEVCIAHINNLSPAPNLVVITGDLVDYGTVAEYTLLRKLLAPIKAPIYLIPGNHDNRENLRSVFSDHRYLHQSPEFVQFSVPLGPLNLIGIDTTVPGNSHGELCAARVGWIDEVLTNNPLPTVILMHHPPFETGIRHMDLIGLRGALLFESVIAKHAQVERLLCGHLHRSIQARFGGTIASTCPSPAHQVVLDLNANALDCFTLEPPGYQLHTWTANRLVSHTQVIGTYPGPFRFREGGQLID